MEISIPQNARNSSHYMDTLLDSFDLVLASMGVYEDGKEFHHKEGAKIYHLFHTTTRKRKGQLVKFCNPYLPDEMIREEAKKA